MTSSFFPPHVMDCLDTDALPSCITLMLVLSSTLFSLAVLGGVSKQEAGYLGLLEIHSFHHSFIFPFIHLQVQPKDVEIVTIYCTALHSVSVELQMSNDRTQLQ
jgi:hypothetical protein